MKVTIKTGKVIPPPPPKRAKKFIIELNEFDAARLYDFAARVSRSHVNDLNKDFDLGEIDIDIMNAFDMAGFYGNEDILPKGTNK